MFSISVLREEVPFWASLSTRSQVAV